MKINKYKINKKGFSLVELLVVITIIVTLLSLSFPAFNAIQRRVQLTKSSSNLRGLHQALTLVGIDYGGLYIDNDIAEEINVGTGLTDSASAFQTLMNSGALDGVAEVYFFTKELANAGVTHTKGNEDGQLTDEECGFTYVAGLSNTSPGRAPLVSTKVATSEGGFYSAVWDHKAIIGRVDGSIETPRIQGAKGTDGIIVEEVRGSETKTNVFDWATGAGGTILASGSGG